MQILSQVVNYNFVKLHQHFVYITGVIIKEYVLKSLF